MDTITIPSVQIEAVRTLCAQYQVARLELFGSAVDGTFNAATSDLDFLVTFQPLEPAARADAYFGLLAALQDFFEREIDLVEAKAVTNPYFRRSIDASGTVLYAV